MILFSEATLALDESTLELNRSNFLASYVLVNLPSKYIVDDIETMTQIFTVDRQLR
jgi:hypothetical protein